jgi:hypothetical protein
LFVGGSLGGYQPRKEGSCISNSSIRCNSMLQVRTTRILSRGIPQRARLGINEQNFASKWMIMIPGYHDVISNETDP